MEKFQLSVSKVASFNDLIYMLGMTFFCVGLAHLGADYIGPWITEILENMANKTAARLMVSFGIDKFILIGENVLNFHASDECYYEEWFDDVDDGWIAMVNFHDHVIKEFSNANLDHYFVMGGQLEELEWRTFRPLQFCQKVESLVSKRIGSYNG